MLATGPFSRILVAAGLSNIGDGMRIVGLPIAASIATHNNPMGIALVAVAAQLPWLAAPVFGAIVDRVRKIRIMIAMDLGRAAVVAAVAVSILCGFGNVSVLFLAALLLGCASVVGESCSQAVIPVVVDVENLASANSRLFAVESLGSLLVGPAVGAWLTTISLSIPFMIDCLSFLASAAILWRTRDDGVTGQSRSGDTCGVWADVGQGLSWAWHSRLIRGLGVILVAIGCANGMVNGILIVFAHEQLDVGATGYGLLVSCAAVGGILGSLVSPAIVRHVGVKASLLLALAGNGVAYLALARQSDLAVAICILGVSNATVMLWNVAAVTLRQRAVPLGLLGRVTTVYRLLAWGGSAIGAMIGGVIAARAGVSLAIGLSGLIIIAGVGLAVRIPSRTIHDAMDNGSEAIS